MHDLKCILDDDNPAMWFERQCKLLGLPVCRVAESARIDPKSICRWKTGERDPSYQNLKRMHNTIKDYWARQYGDGE